MLAELKRTHHILQWRAPKAHVRLSGAQPSGLRCEMLCGRSAPLSSARRSAASPCTLRRGAVCAAQSEPSCAAHRHTPKATDGGLSSGMAVTAAPGGARRVRVEIIGSQNCRIVGKSQSVLIMINPIISTRTRMMYVMPLCWRRVIAAQHRLAGAGLGRAHGGLAAAR